MSLFVCARVCLCMLTQSSMEFSMQEYWSSLPFPILGDLPDQGLNTLLLCFLHCRQILYHSATFITSYKPCNFRFFREEHFSHHPNPNELTKWYT